MKITGKCHCGNQTYIATVDPEKVAVCHCTDCQSISGSPFRWIAVVPEDDFKLLSGEPKTYRKIADSGDVSLQVFCPDCASPLYSTVDKEGPRNFNIRLGTANERDQLRPKVQIWHCSAQSWATSIEETQIKDKQ